MTSRSCTMSASVSAEMSTPTAPGYFFEPQPRSRTRPGPVGRSVSSGARMHAGTLPTGLAAPAFGRKPVRAHRLWHDDRGTLLLLPRSCYSMPSPTPAPRNDALPQAAVADLAVAPPAVDVLGVPLALTDYERTL